MIMLKRMSTYWATEISFFSCCSRIRRCLSVSGMSWSEDWKFFLKMRSKCFIRTLPFWISRSRNWMSFSLADIWSYLISSSLVTSLATTNSEFLGCFESLFSIATIVSLSLLRMWSDCRTGSRLGVKGAGCSISLLGGVKAWGVPKATWGDDSMVWRLKSDFIWVWVWRWMAWREAISDTAFVLSSFCSKSNYSTCNLNLWMTLSTVSLFFSGYLISLR